ncbi:hypothetical protein diail_3525 [Diaporthe ilicicola]|nr:hypothetical protein diail_3525 [Diaporthe ilicicola]
MSALKKQRNKASVAQPPEQTPFAQLHSWMSSGVVTKVYLEALGNASTRPADPTKAGMGKKKNHWALRFMIQHP